MRRLAIVLLCLPACTLNPFGGGPESGSSTSGGPESTTGTGTTSGGEVSTSDAPISTGLDGTSTGTSTEGSSGTTGTGLVCGESLPNGSGGCPDECTSCDSNGVCLFDCTGTEICADDDFVCPEGRPCVVQCSGPSACYDATVICPPDHDCLVRCAGAQACGAMEITCGGGLCELECITNALSCASTEFKCGSNVGSVTCNQLQDEPVILSPSGSMCDCTAEENCEGMSAHSLAMRYSPPTMGPRDKVQDRLFCEIVAQLLIADAAVTDDERAFLERLMDRFDFDASDRASVFGAVDIGQPIDDRLARLDEEHRKDLLGELEAAAAVDGEVGRGEAEILEEVRRALGQ